jgi:hypothetical protein
MGWDTRAIKPGKKNGIDTTKLLEALRFDFDSCLTACNDIRGLSRSDRQTRAKGLGMPDDLLAALVDRIGRTRKNGNLTLRYRYTPRQVAYVWMLRKRDVSLPMSSYKAIERAIKDIGSPAGYHNVRVIVRTQNTA